VVTPAAERKAVAHLMSVHGMSERRACKAIGSCRMTMRYKTTTADDAALRERMKAIAHERRRFGYRRVHVLLKREGFVVNHKRLLRLYREERLVVRRRGGRKRAIGTRAPMMIPAPPGANSALDKTWGQRQVISTLNALGIFTRWPRAAPFEGLPRSSTPRLPS
jgi:putative transposase